jgi:hypothetical protein
MPSPKVISQRREDESRNVRAHVPTVGEQCPGMKNRSSHDFCHHHDDRQDNDFVSALLGGRGIRHKIVIVPPRGNISRVHNNYLEIFRLSTAPQTKSTDF